MRQLRDISILLAVELGVLSIRSKGSVLSFHPDTLQGKCDEAIDGFDLQHFIPRATALKSAQSIVRWVPCQQNVAYGAFLTIQGRVQVKSMEGMCRIEEGSPDWDKKLTALTKDVMDALEKLPNQLKVIDCEK
jgi:hypothetical protein